MSPALESGWASELQPNKCSGSDTTRLPRLVQKRRPSFPPCYLENLDLEPRAMIHKFNYPVTALLWRKPGHIEVPCLGSPKCQSQFSLMGI